MIIRILYNSLLYLAAAVVALYLLSMPRYRALLRRFYWSAPHNVPTSSGRRRFWIHAASLGEVNTATPYVEAFRRAWPEAEIVMTVSTMTGMERATTLPLLDAVVWCPFDLPGAVRRFFKVAQPSALFLMETEIWPNLMSEAARASIPIYIVNARISEKHFRRYRRIRLLIAPALGATQRVFAQTHLDADRFEALGADAQTIEVVGSAKFDGAKRSVADEVTSALRERYGIARTVPVIVFGSTRPGDERRAIALRRALADKGVETQFVIVPRHVERTADICREFPDVEFVRHNVHGEGAKPTGLGPNQVLIVDKVGELINFYALADVAVIGGSFSPDIQGHNPIESAALGIPTVFGPCMKNFISPADILVSAGAATQLQSEAELGECVYSLLHDDAASDAMAEAARRTVAENTGAINATMEALQREW